MEQIGYLSGSVMKGLLLIADVAYSFPSYVRYLVHKLGKLFLISQPNLSAYDSAVCRNKDLTSSTGLSVFRQ